MQTTLTYDVLTETPDFANCGFEFFVEAGTAFDVDVFAVAYGLNRSEIDEQSIKAVQNAATQLNDGEWLEVTFEIDA